MDIIPGHHMDPDLFTQMIRHDEGVRNLVYDDATGQTIGPGYTVKGNPTIGAGRNVGPSGPGLRDGEIDSMLTNDLNWYEDQAATFPWYANLDPVRATVVCSMVFNLGLRSFSQFHDTISCIEKGDWEGAASNMIASRWAQQVGSRAERLSEMMRLGVPIQR